MGKIKNPGRLLWFFILLFIRVVAVFGIIGLIAYGLWKVLYLLLG